MSVTIWANINITVTVNTLTRKSWMMKETQLNRYAQKGLMRRHTYCSTAKSSMVLARQNCNANIVRNPKLATVLRKNMKKFARKELL